MAVNNTGDLEILRRLVGWSTSGNIWMGAGDTLMLRLYRNGRLPVKGDSLKFFIESNGAGYSPIPLPTAKWTIATQNPGAGDTSIGYTATKTFTYTGGDSLFGYFITGKRTAFPGDTVVICAEKFVDGPYLIPSGGGTIPIIPHIIVN